MPGGPKRKYTAAQVYGSKLWATSVPKRTMRGKGTAVQYRQGRVGYNTVARTRGWAGQGEMKYFDTERTATVVPASVDWTATEFPPNVGTPTTLCNPVPGTGIANRNARNVEVHKIRIKGTLQTNQQSSLSQADNPTKIRLLFVQDMQTNAAQAQGESIMEAPVTASAAHAVNTFQSLDNLGRFRVLKDKWITVQNPALANATSFSADSGVISQGLLQNFKFNMILKKPIKVSFNATNGGTIADIVDNSWCVYAGSSSTALSTTISYQARCYFKG